MTTNLPASVLPDLLSGGDIALPPEMSVHIVATAREFDAQRVLATMRNDTPRFESVRSLNDLIALIDAYLRRR